MPTINVATKFQLMTRDALNKAVFRTFDVGLHEVDERTAAHPYVKANLVNAEQTVLPKPGSPEAARLINQAAEAARDAVARVLFAAHNKPLTPEMMQEIKEAIPAQSDKGPGAGADTAAGADAGGGAGAEAKEPAPKPAAPAAVAPTKPASKPAA